MSEQTRIKDHSWVPLLGHSSPQPLEEWRDSILWPSSLLGLIYLIDGDDYWRKKGHTSWVWNNWVTLIPLLAIRLRREVMSEQTRIKDHSWVPLLGHSSPQPLEEWRDSIL
ncbi:mannose-1-phosphate guanyltransferase, partial [Striga asiatica]